MSQMATSEPSFVHSGGRSGSRGPSVGAAAALSSATSDPFDDVLKRIKEQQDKRRAARTIVTSPFHMLLLFIRRIFYLGSIGTHFFVTHRITLIFLVPFLSAYTAAHFALEGQKLDYLHTVNRFVQDSLFWLILGIASSVGFGTGMHSGVLFLFPHIYHVCIAADLCGHLNFATNVFLKGGPAEHITILPIGDTNSLPAYCDCVEGEGQGMAGYVARLAAVFWPCLLWGGGTAIGEIPPYLVALKASRSGEKKEAVDMLNEEANSSVQALEAMKKWMIDLVRKYGFLAVFLLAAWPNAFFDLCGLCCGMIQMPFVKFFGAVFLGKAVVKVNMQAAFFVMLFTKSWLESLKTVLASGLAMIYPNARHVVDEFFEDQLQRFHKGHKAGEVHQSTLSWLMGMVVVLFVAHFLIKCMEELAREQEELLDTEHLEKLGKQRRQAANATDFSWATPREERGTVLEAMLAVVIAAGIVATQAGGSVALKVVAPITSVLLAALGTVHVIGTPKVLHIPLFCFAEYPLVVFIVLVTSMMGVAVLMMEERPFLSQ